MGLIGIAHDCFVATAVNRSDDVLRIDIALERIIAPGGEDRPSRIDWCRLVEIAGEIGEMPFLSLYRSDRCAQCKRQGEDEMPPMHSRSSGAMQHKRRRLKRPKCSNPERHAPQALGHAPRLDHVRHAGEAREQR
ncbi:hypothetical protein [Rudaea cellulosilytica]|uniref:hypothetical protein n=1 Tax=Rudaea cellulosilytica TaxID=540746 RepID=UPI0012F749D0|nr:hypothetical protein [Rudaea cellulosilytica]